MEIEIWSDIACPFCYIGKRQLDAALKELGNETDVKLVWRSFLLDPSLTTPDEETNSIQYLADKKGMSLEQSEDAHKYVTQMAADHGLEYKFDEVKIGNTKKGLLLIKLAQSLGLGTEMEEALFAAHFTHGIQVDDEEQLIKIASAVGIEIKDFKAEVSNNKELRAAFEEDLDLARQIGIRGVPFFVFDRKYAVSGAQGTPKILAGIQQTIQEV